MSISRIFQIAPLKTGAELELDTQATHHLARVLRAKVGDCITLFNGDGGEFSAAITHIDKKKVIVKIGAYHPHSVESSLDLCLAQGIARGEKMDYMIQKAVELGVKKIIPLLTERSTVKLTPERRAQRANHWQSIVNSACEQSGRNSLPTLLPPQTLSAWLATQPSGHRFVLTPDGASRLKQLSLSANASVTLLIGPEGGLSSGEIQQAEAQGFTSLNLGPRILRTETATVAVLTTFQCLFGDLII
jgi:16S rRNA (uracil1498-N3)-methyltransferase